VGDEKVILNPTDRGTLLNVPISPVDHSGEGVEYHPPFVSGSVAVAADLVFYSNLDEQSGTRAKTAGSCTSCDWTAVNAPDSGGGAGKYATLNANNKGLYSGAAALGAANTSFTVSVWIRPNQLVNYEQVAGSDSGVTGTRDWLWQYDSAGAVSNSLLWDSSSGTVALASPANPLVAGTRTLVTLVYNQSTKKGTIYHNTTAGAASSALTNGIRDSYANTGILTAFITGSGAFRGAGGPAMVWGNRALSSSDISDLYAYGTGYSCSALPVALRASLVACWDLTEASGTRAESGIGSCGATCDLTAVNAPGRAPGLVTNGLGLSASSLSSLSQALSIADNADISVGDESFTVACWVNPSVLGSKIIIDKTDEYRLGVDAASKPYAKTGTTDTATWGAATTAGTWIFVAGGHDAGLNKTWVSVNGATRVTTNETAAPADTANDLKIFSTSAGGSYWDGSVDGCAFWKRTVADSTLLALYNAGAGVEYPWTGVASILFPGAQWASVPVYDRQGIIYSKTGVVVPGFMFPSRKVAVR
jgi:hypothetical protein